MKNAKKKKTLVIHSPLIWDGATTDPVQILNAINDPMKGYGMLKLGEFQAAIHPYPWNVFKQH
jgi:hypothetical protein